MTLDDLSCGLIFRGLCIELPEIGSNGDIWHCKGKDYVWHDGWLMLGDSIHKETGGVTRQICKDIEPRICSRCGAPLKGHKCEYCGTEYGI